MKDEYTFGFQELSTAHSERELERAPTAYVEEFLREMGGMFAFADSQHRLSIGGRDYFLDLLLYHRRLRPGRHRAEGGRVRACEEEYCGAVSTGQPAAQRDKPFNRRKIGPDTMKRRGISYDGDRASR